MSSVNTLLSQKCNLSLKLNTSWTNKTPWVLCGQTTDERFRVINPIKIKNDFMKSCFVFLWRYFRRSVIDWFSEGASIRKSVLLKSCLWINIFSFASLSLFCQSLIHVVTYVEIKYSNNFELVLNNHSLHLILSTFI